MGRALHSWPMPSSLEPFSGTETFAAPQERVFAVVTNLDALAAAMPGLVSSEKADEWTLKAVVRPGLSFLGGQIKLTVSIAEKSPPDSALLRVAGQSIGVSMNIESRLKLSPAEGGTKLDWEARVFDMKGLIAAVPAGLIRAAAQKVIGDGWNALRKQVEE